MKSIISSGSRMLLWIPVLFAVITISNSCTKSMDDTGDNGGNGGKGGPGTNEVWIQGMAFNPSTITVKSGTTITWTNKDGVAHTVTSDNNLFNSGSIGNGGTYSYTFSTVGTFQYHCSLHPEMTAKVIVTSTTTSTAAVSINNMLYSPATITVSAGTIITWTNNDSVEHTVTSDNGLFDSGGISTPGLYSSGGTFSHTFSTPGTSPYHCTYHPGMTAKVVVN
jgi:plastocyanin